MPLKTSKTSSLLLDQTSTEKYHHYLEICWDKTVQNTFNRTVSAPMFEAPIFIGTNVPIKQEPLSTNSILFQDGVVVARVRNKWEIHWKLDIWQLPGLVAHCGLWNICKTIRAKTLQSIIYLISWLLTYIPPWHFMTKNRFYGANDIIHNIVKANCFTLLVKNLS